MVKGIKAAGIIPCSGLSLGTQTNERAPGQISKNKSHPTFNHLMKALCVYPWVLWGLIVLEKSEQLD